MATLKKNAFGVFQDGLHIRIAHLQLDGNGISIQRLDKIVLPESLTYSNDYAMDEISDSKEDDQFLTDLMQNPEDDFDEEALFRMEAETDADLVSGAETIKQKDNNKAEIKEDKSARGVLRQFLASFPLEKGIIALNPNEENITYHSFGSEYYSKKKMKSRIESELLSKEEMRSQACSVDFVINEDFTSLGYVHRGGFELLNAVIEANSTITKSHYKYALIDPNEVSLMNFVKGAIKLKNDEYVTIIYLGQEFQSAIVMKGGNYIKTFPIMISQMDKEATLQALYSRLVMEQDLSNTPITEHIVLLGRYSSEQDLALLAEYTQNEDMVTKLQLPFNNISTYDYKEISEYAIPIALAWKALQPRNQRFYQSNLLPNEIIESQKTLKIAWHGFVILGIMFFFTMYGTIYNLTLKKHVVELQKQISEKEYSINNKNREINQVNSIQAQIDLIQANINKIQDITKNSKNWSELLNKVSNYVRSHRITWLTKMECKDNILLIDGYTDKKAVISSISQILPKGQIVKVGVVKIENINMYQFQVSYDLASDDKKEAGAK